MSAVTESFKAGSIKSAEDELERRRFTRTDAGKKIPSQWMNGAHNWATIEPLTGGRVLVKIGVSTL